MFRCVECGTLIRNSNLHYNERIECEECGIELELVNRMIIGLQLGPSEE